MFPGEILIQSLSIYHRMYQKMIKYITVADTVLGDVDTAASEIDRVLEGE